MASTPDAINSLLEDRTDAGLRLAERLCGRNLSGALVLALPRGGVPVGFEIAARLRSPLDVFLVRKLGVPFQPELALGAIASGDIRVLNPEVVALLDLGEDQIERIAAAERRELERRERAYRGDRSFPEVSGRTVILVDDGAATGATMLVAVRALRQRGAGRIVAALPVASREAVRQLRSESDEFVCLVTPEPFYAVGFWYEAFPQVTDEEVRDLLERAGPGGPQPASDHLADGKGSPGPGESTETNASERGERAAGRPGAEWEVMAREP